MVTGTTKHERSERPFAKHGRKLPSQQQHAIETTLQPANKHDIDDGTIWEAGGNGNRKSLHEVVAASAHTPLTYAR